MPAVLTLLRIKNLALVEDLEWQIAPGFIAVTGETGAGKSIIIGALQLLLGERADKSLIRTGADLCTVEAIFSGEDLRKLNPQLAEAGVEPCENDLIIKRSFSVTGGTRQFINGSPTTLSILKDLGDELVDLHGPHDHQSLLSPDKQLALLDSFAHAQEQLGEYRNHYLQMQTLVAEHAALNTAETAREQELDLLRHQISEISAANLVAGEEGEIEARYKLASNSKRLIELASAIARRLSEADDSVLSQLAETQRLLRELEKIDNSITQFSSAHEAAVVELSEIARSLSSYAEKLDLDPAQLSALEQRVSLFETLKRKYGGSIAEVIAFGERAAERLRKIEGRDAELERLAKEIENVRAQMNRAGEALRKLRAKAAPKLSENIRRNLRDLGFRQSEFEAKLSALGGAAAERIRFGGITFLAQSGRTAETTAHHRLERRNLPSHAGNQICAGRARRDSAARLRRDRHERRRRNRPRSRLKDANIGPRSSSDLHHSPAPGSRHCIFAFRRFEGSRPWPDLFAIAGGQRERTPRRDCPDARRQERIGLEACRDATEGSISSRV